MSSERLLCITTLCVALVSTGALGCRASDAEDEAMSGRTLRGTPVAKRTEECFPAEPRDLFWQMDQVADENGRIVPLDFDENRDGVVDDAERDAIRGRNTWLVWGGGNETFWGWLQEQGYGITDLLILLDSRQRDTRFARAGLINQPGFTSGTKQILGLYLDEATSDAWLRPPPGPDASYGGTEYGRGYDAAEPERYDAQRRPLRQPVYRPSAPPQHATELFEPWSRPGDEVGDFRDYIPDVVRAQLPQDGLDPSIYGYPSGIFGLRLWLNPDFFAKTDEAEQARSYWRERVELTNGRYYIDPDINGDPDLVRPFRVSMSCGFCHIGPHPLKPPADPEHPEWENLSGIIGSQYWDPQPSLGILLNRKDFLYHFLKSQAPGTVDTSLISTDQINNTNVINAVFDVPARLSRAKAKAREAQGAANLLMLGLEDGQPRVESIEDAEEIVRKGGERAERHFPMVLFPGEDSVGVFGALARVYLNIGVFGEQWNRVDNPVIGLTPQRPFSIATSRANSVFWNVNEKYRVPYLAKFFTLGSSGKVPKSTAPMRLRDAPGGRAFLGESAELRQRGREVFLDHCAICHSSKQPDGFDLAFDVERKTKVWKEVPAPVAPNRRLYTLPMDYANWEDFKKSASYQGYLTQLRTISDPPENIPYDGKIDTVDRFIENNFLSNELRIPVTLVGTYSGRAMATNAMRGQVWDNFSSETFKALKSVGKIRYFNLLGGSADARGANDDYTDGRTEGGPGYYRPASLISLWATAPYFHNNALGVYTHDPSVDGRMRAFDDGIRKLLNDELRANYAPSTRHPGDLRSDASPVTQGDPGYIYRVPVDTQLAFGPKFIRPLLEGVLGGYLGPLGGVVFSILSLWLWVALVALFVVGVMRGRARHVGILVLLVAVVLAVVLAVTGATGSGGTVMGAMMMLALGAARLASASAGSTWAVIFALGALGFWLLLTRYEWRPFARLVFGAAAVATLILGIGANRYLNGNSGGIRLAPIPRGTPVNLLMNIDPEKRDKLPAAIVALLRAMAEIKQKDLTGDAAYAVLKETAGPALLAASKVPDFVLDRGHWFGENLSPADKEALIAFLKTL
jgi:hypothetical protein